jgi:hypothetical protein
MEQRCHMFRIELSGLSFLQQSGRVGRNASTVVLLLLRDDPREQ